MQASPIEADHQVDICIVLGAVPGIDNRHATGKFSGHLDIDAERLVSNKLGRDSAATPSTSLR